MTSEVAPASVEVPACLLSSELFSGCLTEDRIEDRLLLEVDRPEERLYFTLKYSGPQLGREHLRCWKALHVQRMLRGRDQFEISVPQMMQLLGCQEGQSEQQQDIDDILHDLSSTHLSGGGSWRTASGRKRLFGLASRLGEFHIRDGNYQAFVGPDLGGLPKGVAFDVVPVSRIDIEIASDPPSPQPEPQWLAEQPEPEAPRRRQPTGPGFVYILTNPAMPGLIKIGKTRLTCVEDRARQLYSTGVPDAFEVAYACRTDDPDAVERAMHEAFGPKRVNGRREFFHVQPEQAVAVLSLHERSVFCSYQGTQ